MGFFKGIAKLLLFLFNFAILLCAIALIALGAIFQSKTPGLDIMSVSVFAIALGCIIALISFFGCYGACSTNGCLLTTYAVIMIVLLITQLVLGILAFVALKDSDGKLTSEVTKYLKDLYEEYETKPDQKAVVDTLQRTFECCGVNGPYDNTATYRNGTLISSCCERTVDSCIAQDAYQTGCSTKLIDFFNNHKIIGGIAIGFCAIELIAAIFACCVRKQRDGRYV